MKLFDQEGKTYVKRTELSPWDRNPRSIKKERFDELKKRIKRQGQFKPVIVTEAGIVVGGNMRLRAFEDLGIDDIWVSVVKATTDKEMFDLALTDNEQMGYYEPEQVAELALELGLSELELESYELNLGASTKLSLILDRFAPSEEEDIPELEDGEPASKAGEVYTLGNHRLMCGDSTTDDLNILMQSQKADMVFTDPPYNVDYVGKTKDALKIENDKFTQSAFYDFLLNSFTKMGQVTKSGATIYVCHADTEGLNFRKAFQEAGFYLAQCLVWNKNTMVMGRQDYHWKHEPILYGWKADGGHQFYGGRQQTTVWDIERPIKSTEHPTMKPTALIVRALRNSSKSGDIVLDPFMGSGSTLIACEQTERVCYGMELDPKYCDVIRKRYANLIGAEEWQSATPNIQVAAPQ